MHHAAAAACSTASASAAAAKTARILASTGASSAAMAAAATKKARAFVRLRIQMQIQGGPGGAERCCRKGKCRAGAHAGGDGVGGGILLVEELRLHLGLGRGRTGGGTASRDACGSDVLLANSTHQARSRVRGLLGGDRVGVGFGNGFRTSPSYTMFRRTVASSASVPKRLPPPTASSSAAVSTDAARLAAFRIRLEEAHAEGGAVGVDGEELWEAYEAVGAMSMRTQLGRAEVLRLAKVLLAEYDFWSKQSKEGTTRWAHRLQALVLELRSKPAELTSRTCDPLEYIQVVALALRGNIKEAIRLFASLQESNKSDVAPWRRDVFRHIFMSLIANDSPDAAVDFWLQHEDSLSPSSSSRDVRRRKSRWQIPFRLELARLLGVVSDPVQLLRSCHGRYSFPTVAKFASQVLLVMCHERLVKDALAVFAWCNERRMHLHFSVSHALVKALTNAEMFEEANEIFASMEPKASASRGEVQSYKRTGMRLFAHQGEIDRVRDFAGKDVGDDEIVFLMHAHAVHGEAEEAVKLFQDYFADLASRGKKHDPNYRKPRIQHYSIVLHAFVNRNDVDGMNLWFSRLLKAGFKPDTATYNTVLKGFAQQGDIEKLGSTLDRMRQNGCAPNQQSYTTVMKVLARRRDVFAAEALFKRMLREGIIPDRQAVTTLMNAHVEAGSWKGVIRVFDYMRYSSIREHTLGIEVFNTLLKAYVLIGAPLEVVTKIFRGLETSGIRPTKRTFALLVQAACQSGHINIAYRLLEQMETRSKLRTSNVQVTIEVLTIIMNAHLRAGDRVKARAVYDDMVSRGLKPTANTFASILASYTTASFPDNIGVAQKFIDSIASSPETAEIRNRQQSGRDNSLTMVYSPLLNAYAKTCDVEMIDKLCADLAARGEPPSISVLGHVLDAYRRAGDIEGVVRLWPQIVELALKRTDDVDALLDPHDTQTSFYQSRRRSDLLCIALSIYIDALSRAGRHLAIAHAWNALREHGFQFDAHNWNHLVVALVRAGEPVRAFEVVEKVIIPYSEQSRHIMRERSVDVGSPLLFDDADALEEIVEEPYTAPVARTGKKRETLVELIRRRFDGTSETEDFAHDLQVLQQISPEWSVWTVHEATLAALCNTLRILESGRRVRPQPASAASDEEEGSRNESAKGGACTEEEPPADIVHEKAEAEAARETFLYIISKYFKTIERIEDWLLERARKKEPSDSDRRR